MRWPKAVTPVHPMDLALLQGFKGARFSPGVVVTFPSGLRLTGEQIQELTADL